MDVLLTLIAKHKLNIYDIAISQLLEQYLNYLADCQEQDLELAGAFLEMAARLIYLKTAALLPSRRRHRRTKRTCRNPCCSMHAVSRQQRFLPDGTKNSNRSAGSPCRCPNRKNLFAYLSGRGAPQQLSLHREETAAALQSCHAGEITASGQPENRFGLFKNRLADAKGFPCGNGFSCHAL